MPISVIAKIVQRNNGKFKLMNADAVSYDGSETVSIKDKVDEVINTANKKTIYFVMKDVNPGIQDLECPFPENGEISSINVLYKSSYAGDIAIDIKKASLTERASNTWTSIFDSSKLVVNGANGTKNYTLANTTVNKNDIVIVDVLTSNVYINSLTINIEIILK